jgi:hypothetical protein
VLPPANQRNAFAGTTDPAWSASPIRTCIGCRERAPQGSLLRVAVLDGRPTAHPVSACVRRATQTGSFARSLRAPLAQPAVLSDADGLPVQMESIDKGAAI